MLNTQPTCFMAEFQAGKTKQHIFNWKHLTSDIEILQMVSGLPIERTDELVQTHTAQKMKFSIKDFFSKCDQIRRKLRIWSHLLKKFLMDNFIFCTVSPP